MTSSLRMRGVGLLFVAACAAPLAAAAAQARTLRAERDSDAARSDTARSDAGRRDQLLDRLDSLRREFDQMPMTPAERSQLSRQMTSIVMSLAQLQRTNDLERRLSLEMARASDEIARSGLEMTRDFTARVPLELQPRGWIGINVDAPQAVEMRGQEQFIRYFEYPQIVSVEPNSPAERAGIAAGDLLIAYNGDDLKEHTINVTRLLRPKARVAVTVRRDGDPRVFDVTVAAAPRPLQLRRLSFSSEPPAPGMVMPPDMPTPPSILPQLFRLRELDAASAPIAGARLLALQNVDLGRALGASSGVLVLDVAPGPAARSGLRGGDVIVRANGRPVATIRELRRMVAAHPDDRAVTLDVVRAKRERRLTLKW